MPPAQLEACHRLLPATDVHNLATHRLASGWLAESLVTWLAAADQRVPLGVC